MRRRILVLLGGSLALRPLGVTAQQSMPVVGFLFIGNRERSATWTDAWHKAMGDAGLIEGRNFSVEYRWGEGDPTRLPGFAADLVARRVAVIVTTTEQALAAAKQATRTIPIVFNFIADPIGKGFVESIARPGGNITGIADVDEAAMESKRLQLFHQIVPAASRVGYLVAEQDLTTRRRAIDAVVAAGKSVGVEVIVLSAGKVEEIDSAFATTKYRGIDGILIQSPSTFLYAQQKRVLQAGVAHGMPVASGNTNFAEHGGLMQYSVLPGEVPGLTANYVGRILKGHNVAELPIQHPTKFELSLNLKSAKALGLALPPGLISNADQVIE